MSLSDSPDGIPSSAAPASASPTPPAQEWTSTACILCSINCGLEIRLGSDGRTFERIRGDKAHPTSQGYTCEKALRLDHYQNGTKRLTSPLRRRDDGSFESIDWDTAIAEIVAKFTSIHEQFGGGSIMSYGGGGQGNHLGGAYGSATRAAIGAAYASNALAQEKTGEFWVDGQLFGRPRCHTTGQYEHAEVLVFVGKNPYQSHGFPRARKVLKEVAADPERSMIVIDPRRTETAELADIHLQVRPGGDMWCLGALIATLIDEDLLNDEWLGTHTSGLERLVQAMELVSIPLWCERAGLDEGLVRSAARLMAGATGGVSIFEDLGIQQAPHSTLNSYLEKLLFLLTGNFGVPGGMQIHTRFASLGGGGGGEQGGARSSRVTPVTGERIITGLIPCAAIPDEILTDHPGRIRAMWIESSNPAHSLPDSPRMREALAALDLCVVVDIAMTETAQLADYVLPATSQFEKWEAAFFTLEAPANAVQLRRPLVAAPDGPLAEPEIHRRIVRASGVLDADNDRLDRLRLAADEGRSAYLDEFLHLMVERPKLAPFVPVILYETLGPTLDPSFGEDRASAAVMWGLAQTCFLTYPESVRRAGHESGDALFDAIMTTPSGVVFTIDDPSDTLSRLETLDGRVNLVVDELLSELSDAASSFDPAAIGSSDYPFVLSAGERRSFTANTIYRDSTWRKRDANGALRVSIADADRLGLSTGDMVRITTPSGSATAVAEVTDTLLAGHITLPNGFGLSSDTAAVGVAPNELTTTTDRDWLAGTPHHKHVPARLERVPV